ncbi:unnamed protein product [Dovyalis caffra]|uniref:Uncharacterized protein n=1 Tax=Dovyalis caffra TaxID=77055 RepID=A0AAV1R7K5_9ROSI|nr:unnamed protein product [Dovyalis caffra]CAK7328769.1 unnamed protein product [Dovyalis caffra]
MAFSDRGSLLQAPNNLYKSAKVPQTQSISTTCRDRLGLVDFVRKVGFGGSLISTPLVLVRSGSWSSISSLPADKISEIDQTADLVWLFLSIEKESAVCASHLLLGSAGRHGILSYRHGPIDLFSIGASSSATRFYLTKPRARPRREFALPNSLFDNKAETPDRTFISFE